MNSDGGLAHLQAVLGDFLSKEDIDFLFPYAVTNQHAAFSLVQTPSLSGLCASHRLRWHGGGTFLWFLSFQLVVNAGCMHESVDLVLNAISQLNA